MINAIMNLYGPYGKYITQKRAIPYICDCLLPVERRILLTGNNLPKNKFVKAAKVVGNCMSSFHPHGDLSIYDTLQKLVRLGYFDKQGNWGSQGIKKAKAAAMRYPECKLSNWVRNIAFKYCDEKYIPYHNIEYNLEPIALPSPIALGLIGFGSITGIAFHKTVIPRYNIKDLAIRLSSIVEHNKKLPKIKPNIKNCIIREKEKGSLDNILINGIGKLSIIPKGKIVNTKAKKIYPSGYYIAVNGLAPDSSFNKLLEYAEPKNKNNKNILRIVEGDKEGELIQIIPKRNSENIMEFIWKKFLIKSFNVSCVVVLENGKTNTVGIDNILIKGFKYWKSAVKKYRLNICNKSIDKFIENKIIKLIRKIIEENPSIINSEKDILSKFDEINQNNKIIEVIEYKNNLWIKTSRLINREMLIPIMRNKSISRLIEHKIDEEKIKTRINEAIKSFNDTDTDCEIEISDIIKFGKEKYK